MRCTKRRLRELHLSGLIVLVVLTMSTSAFAQGSIFGTVANSDATTPANGQMSFIGYLDNTDEEIRIESADGAGFDAGNWFDDFQNYLTEAPANPYDYHFYNTSNGEGFQLSGTIPNNSFQQENVTLAAVAWPVAPTGLAGVTVSGTSVVLRWTSVTGLTYHVYRRVATSNGSFFRIDDPTGSLSNHGVADSFFVDNTVSGGASYSYMIIAENGSGNLSAHSGIVTVNTATIDAPVLASISPANGSANGGTTVNIYGSGFDPAGVQVIFGTTAVTATVVSPFRLTAVTPVGTVGAAVNLAVTNTASALTSNSLVGGFVYAPNATPTLAAIGAQTVTENVLLQFTVSASDVDATVPVLTTSILPAAATFVDNANGTGTFAWTPGFTAAGAYNVTFYATDAVDGALVDSEIVAITVNDAGNQLPVLADINDTTVAEAGSLVLTVTATDVDAEIPALSAVSLPTNATFVDNLNGTGTFTFNPDYAQAGVYPVVFKAIDAALAVDSIVVRITVTDVNRLPVLAAIGAQNGSEQTLLTFGVTATDADGVIPVLSASGLPTTAVFTDSLNGAGSFAWTPGFADAGTFVVTFYAADATYPAVIDSEVVTITIGDIGNQAPVLAAIATPRTVLEGATLSFAVTATDPDATIPTLTAVGLPTNATLLDNLNGTAAFSFVPDFTQAGAYAVTFIASDGALADSQVVDITVSESGNIAPTIDSLVDYNVDEGGTLAVTVTAHDPDGGGTFPALSVSTTLSHYTFVDHGDGTGTLNYTPDYYDADVNTVTFLAIDFGTPRLTATRSTAITTNDVNQPPAIGSVGPFTVLVGDSLVFTVSATDPTDPVAAHRMLLSALGMPTGATFTDNANNTGTFRFRPTVSQVGATAVTILAVDQGTPQLSATLPVSVTVVAENIPPVIASIPGQMVLEGAELTVNVTATDPDGATPVLSVLNSPAGAVFVDNGDGTGVFTYTPLYVGQTRIIWVKFRAYDGISLTTTPPVLIQISDAGNQAPVFGALPDPLPTVIEGDSVFVRVSATDPDGGAISLVAETASLPPNATFVDSGNGAGSLRFLPNFTQAGLYDINILAYDGPVGGSTTLSSTLTVPVTVTEAGNQQPVLAALAATATVLEGATLTINVSATDPDGTTPTLSAAPLPTNATFTDNANGSGVFRFTPDLTQAGVHVITFTAGDGELSATREVTITVNDDNQLPFVYAPDGVTVYEGDTVTLIVTSHDGDGTMPYLSAHLVGVDTLATNMTFVDSRDSTGTLTFIPSHLQGGSVSNPTRYSIIFVATDEDYPEVSQTTEPVVIRVINRNQPPQILFIDSAGPFSANEGDTVAFQCYVSDLDGISLATLTAHNMPSENATFEVAVGIGTFWFYPSYTQAGTYQIRLIAVDEAAAADTALVDIEIIEAGNQPPKFAKTQPDTLRVSVGKSYNISVTPVDPDLDSISIEAYPILPGCSWKDNGDGTGSYLLTADAMYLNATVDISFVARDFPSMAADTMVVPLEVVSFLRGDLDDDGSYTINDVAYLIGYLFRDGPGPWTPEVADVDGNGSVNVGDASFLIYYMWYYGVQPPK